MTAFPQPNIPISCHARLYWRTTTPTAQAQRMQQAVNAMKQASLYLPQMIVRTIIWNRARLTAAPHTYWSA